MKRFIAVNAFIVLCFLANTAFAGPDSMSLQVRKGDLRSTPSFLGKIVAFVKYGDRLQVLEQKDAWTKVLTPNKMASGWIHTSALTKKRIKLKSGSGAQLGASSGELALAGKGFSAEVEAEFKAKNRDVDFTLIDAMEQIKVPHHQIKIFLENGQVKPKGGDAK